MSWGFSIARNREPTFLLKATIRRSLAVFSGIILRISLGIVLFLKSAKGKPSLLARVSPRNFSRRIPRSMSISIVGRDWSLAIFSADSTSCFVAYPDWIIASLTPSLDSFIAYVFLQALLL